MSSQSNWNNPNMYYQQPQSSTAEHYGVQGANPNTPYGSNTQHTAVGPAYIYQPLPPNNTLAIIALVSSISGFFMFPIIGGIVGVIMGHMAKKQISETGERGEGMVTAALWVGYVGAGLWILGLLAIGLLYLGMFALIIGMAGVS